MSRRNVFNTIEEVQAEIQNYLDDELKTRKTKKVALLFACNSSGKTRLSKHFYWLHEGIVLYFNAYTEDLFVWDNKNFILNIQVDEWIFSAIKNEGLIEKATTNFQKLTGLKLEPEFDMVGGQIKFSFQEKNIKISRSEERILIWSVYYTILEATIEELNKLPEERTLDVFKNFEYVVIDDPVSSIDDTRIITIALDLAELIAKSENRLKFLIMTHHPLFFNVLFNFGKRQRKWDRKNYVLSVTDSGFMLKGQGDKSPFAYHHLIISEIQDAIAKEQLKKYHFNLFRALLEKTANFLGYVGWNKLFAALENEHTFIQKLNHFSHDSLSDLDQQDLTAEEVEDFTKVFYAFISEFNWEKSNFKIPK